MDKLDATSLDLTKVNIEKLKELFPSVVTEGKINFDKLRIVLGDEVDDCKEKYQFTWPGKNDAIKIAQIPSSGTLRPDKESSKNWESTENLYIEGDNLEVLKQLQKTYYGKIKMIYIDPPYNTGNDFIYKDTFIDSLENYKQLTVQGMTSNPETNGRYHSDWLNMMYPRLCVAKNLMCDNGVIFISIGQEESYNLIKICNEIFGEGNRVGVISRLMKSGGNKGQYFSPNIEYILVYAKYIHKLSYFREALSDEIINTYNHTETEGQNKGEKFTIKGLCQPGLGIRPNQRYWIEAPDGSFLIPKGVNFPPLTKEGEKILPDDEDTCWKWTYDRYIEEKKKGNIYFQKSKTATALVDENGNIAQWNVFNKIWLKDRLMEGRVPVDLITKWENRISSTELKDLNIPFDFAKPSDLIKYLLSIVDMKEDDIILDFFSGSATTAHAIFNSNVEKKINQKFILVQLPEECLQDSDAYKQGYQTICDIGKTRIKRAGNQIRDNWLKNNQGEGLLAKEKEFPYDIGFKVFKLDSTNIKPWDNENQIGEQTLLDLQNVFKEDRTKEDVLYEIMLKYGVFDMQATEIEVNGKTMYRVGKRYMVVCLEDNVTSKDVEVISELSPRVVIFKEAGFSNDNDKINAAYNLKKTGVEDVKCI